ncbi:hypothetical protein F4820DRAFT_445825 [Hypoxylon rubiginosum]|uniref:Uncharacterized protein n=1 Tax=Hypoxylon rubiginosum TaxID=110542 RepID=A0ACB9Z7A9_9PEZI|nr:hypothetical protein F4820DRAFT_445825 [Hypoxylon rubiginosum]
MASKWVLEAWRRGLLFWLTYPLLFALIAINITLFPVMLLSVNPWLPEEDLSEDQFLRRPPEHVYERGRRLAILNSRLHQPGPAYWPGPAILALYVVAVVLHLVRLGRAFLLYDRNVNDIRRKAPGIMASTIIGVIPVSVALALRNTLIDFVPFNADAVVAAAPSSSLDLPDSLSPDDAIAAYADWARFTKVCGIVWLCAAILDVVIHGVLTGFLYALLPLQYEPVVVAMKKSAGEEDYPAAAATRDITEPGPLELLFQAHETQRGASNMARQRELSSAPRMIAEIRRELEYSDSYRRALVRQEQYYEQSVRYWTIQRSKDDYLYLVTLLLPCCAMLVLVYVDAVNMFIMFIGSLCQVDGRSAGMCSISVVSPWPISLWAIFPILLGRTRCSLEKRVFGHVRLNVLFLAFYLLWATLPITNASLAVVNIANRRLDIDDAFPFWVALVKLSIVAVILFLVPVLISFLFPGIFGRTGAALKKWLSWRRRLYDFL